MIKLPIVVGATATGKSALGVRLAKALNGEIISGDSAQVYRGMDIGTAKISEEEKCGVPHHLIDILDIAEPFSAGAFAALGAEAARKIDGAGKVPIVVGGTGFYVDALTGGAGFSETADSDPKIRGALMERAEREGAEALHDYLKTIDPISAAAIHPNNVKRVARAIEIFLVTGKTKTEHAAMPKPHSEFKRGLILLDCPDRAALYRRIDKRVDAMLESGLVEEARILWERGLADTPTASAAIGYKEFFAYFNGDVSLETAVDAIKQATRNYAKRQITYFKRMEGAFVLDCTADADSIFAAAVEYCRDFLKE